MKSFREPAREIPVVRDVEAIVVGGGPAGLAAAMQNQPFDWLLSIANLDLIPDALLALPTRGAVNFHDGPLPRYAGLNAPVWALINGEVEYGISWHMIAGGVDEGALVAQQDAEPVAWSRPTDGWQAGEQITDGYGVPLPPDLPPVS